MIRYLVPPVNFEIERVKTIDFSISKVRTLLFDFQNIIVGEDTHAHYEGEYVITPRVYQQSMQTNDMVMDDDVTVLPIPMAKVSNPQGGNTATIG